MGDHLYTTDDNGELATARGYNFEGVTGYVFNKSYTGNVPVYRFLREYNNETSHFYSLDPEGEGITEKGYNKESSVWYLLPSQYPGTKALNRWKREDAGDYLLTTDPNGEMGFVDLKYVKEATLGYIFEGQLTGTVALRRYFFPQSRGINYDRGAPLSGFTFSNRFSEKQKKEILKLFENIFGTIAKDWKQLFVDMDTKADLEWVSRRRLYIDVDDNLRVYSRNGVGARSILNGEELWISPKLLEVADLESEKYPDFDLILIRVLAHHVGHLAGFTHPKDEFGKRDYRASVPSLCEISCGGAMTWDCWQVEE